MRWPRTLSLYVTREVVAWSSIGLAAFTIVLALAACGGGEAPSSAPRTAAWRPAPRPTQARQPAVSETSFVANNGSFDLFVIRASELAIRRSSSPRVRDFARTMIADHKGTSGQLSFEGRRLNLLPSATLLPNDQAMLDALGTPLPPARSLRHM